MLQSGVIARRGIAEVQVPDAQLSHRPRHRASAQALTARLSTRGRAREGPGAVGRHAAREDLVSQAPASHTAAAGAWRWIQRTCSESAPDAQVGDSSWLASLIGFQHVITEPEGETWLALVPTEWCVLAWPLAAVTTEDLAVPAWTLSAATFHWKFVDSEALAQWLSQPVSIECGLDLGADTAHRQRLLLRANGPAQPLVARALGRGANGSQWSEC